MLDTSCTGATSREHSSFVKPCQHKCACHSSASLLSCFTLSGVCCIASLCVLLIRSVPICFTVSGVCAWQALGNSRRLKSPTLYDTLDRLQGTPAPPKVVI